MTQTAPCLFELGTQDLPAKQLTLIRRHFVENLMQNLQNQQLKFSSVDSFITPRRLAVIIHDLETDQPTRQVERRGPAVSAAFDAKGQPLPACVGFAKSCGVEVKDLQQIDTEKGKVLAYTLTQPGKSSAELLPGILELALKNIPLPKTMRWGANDFSFSRPASWCLLRHASEVIPCTILGISSGAVTYGHRFHHPEPITLDVIADYPKVLEQAMVIADFDVRRDRIQAQLNKLAAQEQAEIVQDPELLEEVTGLVEWPESLLVSFDEKFLQVPEAALVAAMRDHQKSFALRSNGKLIPKFITVSNIKSDNPSRVIEGNQRVMRARLSDAAFFYETDLKLRLDSYLEQTKHVVFQAKLGSLYEKSQRVANIASHIAERLQADVKLAFRAGLLSKCDLLTSMVGEFPELQGIMGEVYAKHDGEPADVAVALREQYNPAFSGDSLPQTTIGSAVALADRLDTLIGTFGIGQKPTGVKDPFKCRRAALGIVRILIENRCELDILDLLTITFQQYPQFAQQTQVVHEVHEFILERLQAYYSEQGVPTDVLAAVLSRQNAVLSDLHLRIQAVLKFRELEEAPALAAANKRVSRILQKEQQEELMNGIDSSLLQEPAERTLATLITDKKAAIHAYSEAADYTQILLALASLREPVDRFFNEVMVNVEEEKIRHNRLALLSHLRRLFLQVADISLLQDQR